MKFVKKPVVIEAFQWLGSPEQVEDPEWAIEKIKSGEILIATIRNNREQIIDCSMYIKTLEGTMTASIGDWIIKGVNGEVYPCKPDIFEKTYEIPNEQTAQEMFEKLGYTLDAKAEDCMSYSNENNQIFFYEFNKTYSFRRLEDDMSEWVGVKLHQAITQQMCELGWLDNA